LPAKQEPTGARREPRSRNPRRSQRGGRQISLNLADASGLLATARGRAVADARVKAAQHAKALGQPLGPVLSVSDQTPAPEPIVPFANAAAGKAASVPISPGSQQLSVSVTVVYALA
jgi:uncharacterized protein